MTYLSPGVYIEEVPSGPQPIAAAPTSVLAIVGTTQRGPYMRPTRVPGWAEFVRTFGARVGDLFTAEAVYGFFENGGPAAYVVRVDPSLVTEWTVGDGAGAEVFTVQASSPGAWANDLDVVVAPDTSGGSGQSYLATVGAAANLPGGAEGTVQVSSTVGIGVGDKLTFISATGTANATVNDVTATSLRVTKSGTTAFAVAQGDMVTGRTDPADTSIRLAAANGFKNDDLLLIELPDRTRRTVLISSAAQAGTGMALTLSAAPGGSAVPGAQFTERTDRFRGEIGTVDSTVALGEITWGGDPDLRPTADDILSNQYRAFAANGLQGRWNPGIGAGAFDFGTAVPPPGPIEVEAAVAGHLYTEAINLANPTLAVLAERFSFVPEQTVLRLSDGTNNADLTRTATGFTTTDSLTRTFTTATFRLPSNASRGVVVRCAREPQVGDRIAIGANVLRITEVTSPGGSIYALDFAETTDLSGVTTTRYVLRAFQPTRFVPLRFKLAVSRAGTTVEEYPNLALASGHPRYYFRDDVINEVSTLIRVMERDDAIAITETTMPATVARTQSGADRPATSADYKAGFAALEAEPEPAMVICPDVLGFADDLLRADVIGSMIGHCEQFRRFAIVDGPNEADDQSLVAWRNTTVDSTYAAVYAPHVTIVNLDPAATDRFRTVPPSGFVAGVFARTDRERGVHKAPGNERVRGIVGLAQSYTQRRQDLLNPVAVNLIRAFPGRGTRIWGARNATDDVTWRYVNVRRLFNSVEVSVERGTQWVVFEPNTASTWLRVKVSVENFLDQLWRAGALAGSSAQQAYRVRVGLGETMTETDIDLGLIIIEVAIAPAKPAEFVVFRFSHKRLTE